MRTDDQSRRDTPLAVKLKARIRREGPLSVADYMHACLQDPEFGYYVTQSSIGRAGDFITAPEISQVFGELIGLWAAVVWQQMGSPPRVNLVELGPGRGTLMRDALRAARLLPNFFAALNVHLVESNDTLRSEQAAKLADAGVPLTFHSRMKKVFWDDAVLGGLPTIVIGNEFLDTFGVHQFVFADGAWRAREVSLNGVGQLQFVVNDQNAYLPKSLPPSRDPVDGDVFEAPVDLAVFAGVYLARCAQNGPFAALFIDYGHEATGFGDTLQAVADHKSVPPLHAPGESDLTAQVDFAQFRSACLQAEGGVLACDGPVTQAEFLGRLGIVERASRLMSANPAKAGEIEIGVARLMAPQGMGTRFKAIGVRSAGLPPLPGLDSDRR